MRPNDSSNLPKVPNGINQRVEAIEITDAMKTIIDEQAGVTYVGKAHTGCNTDSPHWQIKRITVSGSLTIVEFAEGNSKYTNIFDDRATLNYR